MIWSEVEIEWPELEHYSDTPMFNTKAVVRQTGVPAPTLRAWERRYKLLSPERANNDYRLYSERDIVMIRWLKLRVDHGMSIRQAIALFRHMSEEHPRYLGHLGHLSSQPTQPLQPPEQANIDESSESQHQHMPPAQPTKPGEPPTFSIAFEPGAAAQKQSASESERESSQQEEDLFYVPYWTPLDTNLPQSSFPAVHNMRSARENLLEAFTRLDELQASMLTASMLAIYPVEQVCIELITPTMQQIGQLWAEGKVTVSVEHFASNFFRGLLANLFHVTPGPGSGPLVIVGCAPSEPHELAPLMLALFLRRSSVRVAYLGQSIETASLMHTIRHLKPALIGISLTLLAYMPMLKDLAQRIQDLPPPRPTFAFGGQAFEQYATIIPEISGVYLNGDLRNIVSRLCNMLLERAENRN